MRKSTAKSKSINPNCHCEERSDVEIRNSFLWKRILTPAPQAQNDKIWVMILDLAVDVLFI